MAAMIATAPPPARRKPRTVIERQDRVAEYLSEQRAAARDIVIPPCANPARRAACERDFGLFIKTYFVLPPSPERFPRMPGWCRTPPGAQHLELIAEIERRVLYGGIKAVCMSRGYGKDTLIKVAAIWAALFGHRRFIVLAAFKAEMADVLLDNIKAQIEINDLLCEDFPEVCVPIRALGRSTQKAAKQTCKGEFTRSRWGAVVELPHIPGSVASGCILKTASINGAIRGMVEGPLRPDFVFLTDPQTRESAKSLMQREDTMAKFRQDFGGLGGHDRSAACLVACTIIQRGDAADQLTDAMANPQYGGVRYKAIERWPANVDLWERYLDAMREDGRKGDSAGRGANALYLANRAEMDTGAVVGWPEAFDASPAEDGTLTESSHLQHLYNWIHLNGLEAFQIEFQGEPVDDSPVANIEAGEVAKRLSQYPQFVAPPEFNRLVGAIDVRGTEIHSAVLACHDDGRGVFVDYAIDRVFAKNMGENEDARIGDKTLGAAVVEALTRRRTLWAAGATPFRNAGGAPMTLSLVLVDSGWLPDDIYRFVRESGSLYRPTKGCGAGRAAGKFVVAKTLKPRQLGEQWFAQQQASRIWLWSLNADYWKHRLRERWVQEPGTPGALAVYGNSPHIHRTFANHQCAEEWDAQSEQWVLRSRYNHFLDCAYMCLVAANMIGIGRKKRDVPKAAGYPAGGVATLARETTASSGWKIGR